MNKKYLIAILTIVCITNIKSAQLNGDLDFIPVSSSYRNAPPNRHRNTPSIFINNFYQSEASSSHHQEHAQFSTSSLIQSGINTGIANIPITIIHELTGLGLRVLVSSVISLFQSKEDRLLSQQINLLEKEQNRNTVLMHLENRKTILLTLHKDCDENSEEAKLLKGKIEEIHHTQLDLLGGRSVTS